MGAEAPAMIEKTIPEIRIGRFDVVVKKKRARHGAFAESSDEVISLAGSEFFAVVARLVPEMGRLLCWRYCSTAGGMRKISRLP